MRFALGRLRWTPREFWSATPIELALAIEGALGRRRSEPIDRAAFEALMRAFPDAP
jgi:uncharacterized phage protein (TIGR02216 family)